MGYERRGIDPGPNASVYSGSGQLAENDVHFTEYVYNDTAGALTIGLPVYKDLTDAGEFNASNNKYATLLTYQTTGANTVRSGGRVVLGTNANAGSLATISCVGIYQPENPGEIPVPGQVIRVLDRGEGVVSAQSPAGGAAGLVGSLLVASVAVKQAVPSAAKVPGITIGNILATRTFTTVGSSVFAAASATVTFVNASIQLT
jgi:hypothetical protein